MRALYIEKGKICLKNLPAPKPKSNELKIRIRKAGICNTDLELLEGYMDFQGIPGHEFVGEVTDGPAGWKGRRVVGEINISCGRCEYCRRGVPTHCPNRTVLGIQKKDGVFAEYVTLPARNCLAVPESVTDRQAVFVEPLAAALEMFEQIPVSHSDRVVVLGDGKLGQLIARVMRLRTPHVLCIGSYERKLEILGKAGIETCLYGEPSERIFDIVVEATGSRRGVADALNLVRPRGVIVCKSTFRGNISLDISRIVVNEIRFIGSRCGPFSKALDLLVTGALDVEPLIDAEFSLDEGIRAFEAARRPGALKILLNP